MKLEFLYAPTRDLQAALALYRDELGWEEAWREGETTVSLKLPGTDVQLMLDATVPDGGGAFGPIFVLDDVKQFFAERPAALRAERGAGRDPGRLPGDVRGSLRQHPLRDGPVDRRGLTSAVSFRDHDRAAAQHHLRHPGAARAARMVGLPLAGRPIPTVPARPPTGPATARPR